MSGRAQQMTATVFVKHYRQSLQACFVETFIEEEVNNFIEVNDCKAFRLQFSILGPD